MKKSTIFTALLLGTALIFSSCGGSGGGSGKIPPEKYFWGHWTRMDTTEKWYINDRSVKIGDELNPITTASDTSLSIEGKTLEKSTKNVIKVTQGSAIYYLFRNGGAQVEFTGALKSNKTGSKSPTRGLGGVGGINVIISNLNNPSDSQTLTTDDDGEFTATETIPGDEYSIKPAGGDSVIVTPRIESEDIGVITITDEQYNFKMTYTSDADYMYAKHNVTENKYNINLNITNVGNLDITAGNYTLSSGSDDLLLEGQLADIIGTIEPGKSKDIVLTVSCGPIAGEYEDKVINIQLTDVSGNRWNDRVTLRFWQRPVYFNMRANSNLVNGVILTPERRAVRFSTDSYTSVKRPFRSTDYMIVFSGASADTESKYSFAVNAEPDSDFSSFVDSTANEPNDTEDQPTKLEAETSIMAFLHKNDIDFYEASIPPSLPEPDNVSATDGAYADRVNISWPEVSGAESYYVYRDTDENGSYYYLVGTSTGTSLNDTNLNAKSHYFYKVKAYSESRGLSAFSPADEGFIIPIKSFNAGKGNSFIIDSFGNYFATGYNGGGQLGDGTPTNKTTFSPIIAIVSSVSAGDGHTMILKADGSLWATGRNDFGQLGDKTNTNRSTPVKIMTGVSSVSAGYAHTMILKADGTLWATGKNDSGQLGDGTTTNRSTPVPVMTGVSSVSAGGYHTMILKADGSLWATGMNYSGQLGDGTNVNKSTPVEIMPGGVSFVSAGGWHTMILKTDGSLRATGYNQYGQLGDGTTEKKLAPVKIMTGVSSVSAGYAHTMILKADGSLWATGENGSGQLGDGTTAKKLAPVKIMPGGVSSVSAGGGHTMILKTDGSLWATGYNEYGQLGDGTTENRNNAFQVMTGVLSVSAGNYHTMILKTDGSLWATGSNSHGQLGDGTTAKKLAPVKIMTGGVSSVSIGGYYPNVPDGGSHTMILKTDGSLWAVGRNDSGQLGDGTTEDKSTPVEIKAGGVSGGVSSVSAGGSHTMILKTDGSLWATGSNSHGQLGDGGITTSRSTPFQIMAEVASVSAGESHTMILKTNGSLWAAGSNGAGQLGDGSSSYTLKKTPEQIMTGVSSVSAGGWHTMILKTNGSLWAAGANSDGQLGDGTYINRNLAFQVMTGVASVSAGYAHTMILKTNGSLCAAGLNEYGQLGDGTTENRNNVFQVMTGVLSVSAGYYHTMILKTDGSFWTTGRNTYGELGDGTYTGRLTPGLVSY